MSNYLDAVLAQWCLGSYVVSEPLHHKATVFRVTISGGASFILKEVGDLTQAVRLASEHGVLLHLHAAEIPVAVPLLTHAGQLYVEHRDKIYTLTPALSSGTQGTSVDSGQMAGNIGAAIGRLHRALASYPHQIVSWQMDLPRWILGEAVPKITARLSDAAMANISELLTCALIDLPTQHIHGDCHGGNILLSNGKVSGFIDLDHLPIGPKVYDLASYLADRIKWKPVDADQQALWLTQVTQVIRGYEQENTLSLREKDALWYGLLAVQLLMMEWFLLHEDDEHIARNSAAFYWLYHHREEIARSIAEAAR